MRTRDLQQALARAVTAALAALACGCHDDADGARDAGSCAPVSIDGAALDPDVDGCVTFRSLPCGLSPDARVDNCVTDPTTCVEACEGVVLYCQLASESCESSGALRRDAATVVECVACPNAIAGRPPRGLVATRARGGPSAGEHFAAMAHLEAASVRAFVELEASLAAFGAPARLRRGALRAAADERRHARSAARVARRLGSRPARVEVRPGPPPSLAELLEDGVVHGCVGETFGALLLTWQARTAEGPRRRRMLAAIARDEVRHAALAWGVLRWGLPRLEPGGRERVGRAMRSAIAALEQACGAAASGATRLATGLPGRAVERHLRRALAEVLREQVRRHARLHPCFRPLAPSPC